MDEEFVLIDDPRWAPLEKYENDPLQLDDWMWMEAWVRNGDRIEVYKHYMTRQTIQLHANGRRTSRKTLSEWQQKFGHLDIREVGRGAGRRRTLSPRS